MWIMTNKGMLSIVQHREDENVLLVRSRDQNTLLTLFPNYEPTETPVADYRWRIMAPRAEVAAVVIDTLNNVDYDNFKNSVDDDELHDAYLGVWTVMHRYQRTVCGPAPYDYTNWNPTYEMELGQGMQELNLDEPPDDEELQEAYPEGWPLGIDASTGKVEVG